MTFQLKQLFHREGDTLPVDYEIPPQALSQIRGYRFDQPVHVTGTFRNRAGIVTLDLTDGGMRPLSGVVCPAVFVFLYPYGCFVRQS